MKWLYNDGRSSVLGQDAPAAQDSMSLGSLQARSAAEPGAMMHAAVVPCRALLRDSIDGT